MARTSTRIPTNGPESDEAVGIPGLVQVSNVQVTRVDVDFLTVEWDAVTGTGVEYKVQWKSGTDDYDDNSVTIGGTSYTISPLEAGTQYTIRVLATKDGREGEPSAEVTATTKADPNQIANLEVTEEAQDQLTVEWDEVPGRRLGTGCSGSWGTRVTARPNARWWWIPVRGM